MTSDPYHKFSKSYVYDTDKTIHITDDDFFYLLFLLLCAKKQSYETIYVLS